MASLVSPPPLPLLMQVVIPLKYAAPQVLHLDHALLFINSFCELPTTIQLRSAAANRLRRSVDSIIARLRFENQLHTPLVKYHLAGALQAAITNNDLKTIKKIHELHPEPLVLFSRRLALKHGTLEVVEWVMNNRQDRACCPPDHPEGCASCNASLLHQLARRDTARVLDWFHDQGWTPEEESPVDCKAGIWRAMLTNVELLKWFETSGGWRINYDRLLLAALRCIDAAMLETLRYLLEHWRGSCVRDDDVVVFLVKASCQPAMEPVIECVLTSRLGEFIQRKVKFAVTRRRGRRVLQWDEDFVAHRVFKTNDYNDTIKGLYENVAMRDFVHVDMLRWLLEERGLRIPVSYLRFERAPSQHDLMKVLRYLLDINLSQWSPFVVSDAAGAGYLNAVKWLCQTPSSQSTTSPVVSAAANGHVEVVKWLLDNTDFATSGAMLAAAANGHVRVVKLLYAGGIVDDLTQVKAAAACGGHLPTLIWLSSATDSGCLRCVVRIMLEDPGSMRAQGGDTSDAPVLYTLQWLEAYRDSAPCGGCTGRQVDGSGERLASIAARIGDIQLLGYLHRKFPESFWSKNESPLEIAERVWQRGCFATVEKLFALFQWSVNWESLLVSIANTPGRELSTDALQWLKTNAKDKAAWEAEYLVQLALRDFEERHSDLDGKALEGHQM